MYENVYFFFQEFFEQINPINDPYPEYTNMNTNIKSFCELDFCESNPLNNTDNESGNKSDNEYYRQIGFDLESICHEFFILLQCIQCKDKRYKE